jgi:ABC-type multidrug transport system fused ATPase/permease subunit
MEALRGLLIGLLSGFFLFYTLQPSQPYPAFLIQLSEKPWIFVVLFVLTWFLFYIDQRIALLFLLILIMIIIDIEFLGRSIGSKASA